MPAVNSKKELGSAGRINRITLGNPILHIQRHLPEVLAVAAACVFIVLATYRIELPGLYMDEVDFVNAAQGAHDNTMIYMRLGSVPLLIQSIISCNP